MKLLRLAKVTIIIVSVIFLMTACASKNESSDSNSLEKEPVLQEMKLFLTENTTTTENRMKAAEAIRTAAEFSTLLQKSKCLELANLIEQGEIEKATDLYNELKEGK